MRPAEALLALGVVAVVGGVVVKQVRKSAKAPAPPTAEDSAFNVPLERTAAARLKVVQARIERARGMIQQSGPGTFIGAILAENDSVVRHWIARPNAPLKVWIQVPTGVADYQASYPDLVKRGFWQWEGADGQPMRFDFVADSATAQVIVVWTERLDGNRIGLTRTEALNDETRYARVTIATRRDGNVPLRDADIFRCAMHEVGHLLGLSHTPDPASIMAPESAQQSVAHVDLETVRLLYALPIGSIKSGATW
ncbi:MAG: matrixin family metalloprotease [Gemmatimonadetes bacterium]|nr:matrixin family metalloprotease [Gemmatimonadota bacterium]